MFGDSGAEDDVNAVQRLLESDPGYTEQVTGHPPRPSDVVSLLIGRPENMAAEGDRNAAAHRLRAFHEAMVVPAKGGDRAALGDTDLHFTRPWSSSSAGGYRSGLRQMLAAYRGYQPPAGKAHVAACVWEHEPAEARVHRVVPDGCVDLIWFAESELVISGADTGPRGVELPSRLRSTGIRLRPGAAGAVLGLPASELCDRQIGAGAVWGEHGARLQELMTYAPPARRLELLADAVAQRTAEPDALVITAARRLAAPGARVASVASELGVGERLLHRRMLAAVGYGPKLFSRVARLRRLLMARSGASSLSSRALAAGYASQAHERASASPDRLRAYRNPDGGFGHGLEPDVRAPESEPAAALHAMEVLAGIGALDDPMLIDCAAWIGMIADPDGGVPLVLPTAAAHPRAPWMVPSGGGSHLTFAVAGALWEADSSEPWLRRGTRWCWAQLEHPAKLNAYPVKFALNFPGQRSRSGARHRSDRATAFTARPGRFDARRRRYRQRAAHPARLVRKSRWTQPRAVHKRGDRQRSRAA